MSRASLMAVVRLRARRAFRWPAGGAAILGLTGLLILIPAGVRARGPSGAATAGRSCLRVLDMAAAPAGVLVAEMPSPCIGPAVTGTAPGSFGPAAAAAPGRHAFADDKSVGKLYFHSLLGERSCTAEVLNSPQPPRAGTALILTAAHCVTGVVAGEPYADDHFVIAPGWARGRSPYGRWTIPLRNIFVDKRWLDCPVPVARCATNPQYDYAIMIVDQLHHHTIGSVTGSNGAEWNSSFFRYGVRIIGYPDGSPESLTATTDTSETIAGHEDFLTGQAPRQGDGTSGGPWFDTMDLRPGPFYGTGTLIGDTGGDQEGGPASGVPSYSPHWTSAFIGLVRAVQKVEKREEKRVG
jgi:hypothetical protein